MVYYRRMFRAGVVLATVTMLAATGPGSAGAQDAPRDEGRPLYPTSGFGHVDRTGLTEHVFNCIVNGATAGALYGVALSSSTDELSVVRVGTGLLLGAAAGLVVPLVRNPAGKEVRSGDIVFINVAQNVGFAHGMLLPLLVGPNFGDWSSDYLRVTFALSATSGLVAGGLAAHVADEQDFTPGQASALGAAGLWGGLTGLGLMLIARPRDPGDGWGRATVGATLLAADAAMAAVWLRRDVFDIDRGRVFVANVGGAVGALVGFAAAFFVQPRLDNDRVLTGAMLAGALAGVGTAFVLTDDWDDYKKSAPPPGATGLSLIEYRGGRLSAGLPMPGPGALIDTEGRSRLRPLLSLASGSF